MNKITTRAGRLNIICDLLCPRTERDEDGRTITHPPLLVLKKEEIAQILEIWKQND